MKIGFIGNLNNFNFCIVRYLRDQGMDAHLLLMNEPEHFKPHSDDYSDDYMEYTTSLNWNWRELSIFINRKNMKAQIKSFDKLVGINFAPAYCALIDRPLDIFVPAGSDIYRCPFEFFIRKYKFKLPRDYYYDIWARLQRKGIEQAKRIVFDKTNPELEAKISPLQIQDKRIFKNPPFLYYPQYKGTKGKKNLETSIYFEQFKKLRALHDLIVFQHCRQDWNNSQMIYYNKGNDKLISAFARVVKNKDADNPLLVLFEYGKDVVASKELIRELEITQNVIWMPLSLRKDIMTAISFCDIGVGELGEVSWLSYATVFEFLCMEKPFIGYRKDELYANDYDQLYPMYSTNTTDGVYDYLCDYIKSPQGFIESGKQGFEWFKKYAIEDPINLFHNLLTGKEAE